jgi:hypothetical protein
MPSKAYGIELGEFIPQPNFRAVRDAKGSWSGSQSYKMLRTSYEGGVAANFAKGVTITSLYPELSAAWDFLELETWDLANHPGDIVEVTAQFSGFDESEYESDREVTYVLSGTRVERSILLHPLYIKEVQEADPGNHVVIVQAFQGLWVLDTSVTQSATERIFRDVALLAGNHSFTPVDTVKWVRFILEDGNRTYMAPTLQWIVETSNRGGLTDGDIDPLGREDEPEGNPPQPFLGDFVWMMIALSENRTQGQSSTSRTWEMSPPGGFPKFNNGKSVYDYDNSDISSD